MLPPPDGIDQLGGFTQSRLDSSLGYKIATYIWKPSVDLSDAKAVVFLVHGVLAHSQFEWLARDEDLHHVLLHGSIVESLLQKNALVIAHDHPGHGRSTGMHAYVDSHDDLRDVTIEVISHFMANDTLRGKKVFVIGMSMGGTTAIRVCAKRPDLVDGYALLSPAVRTPDDMFGAYGQFLMTIRPFLSALVPKLPVLSLPPSEDENIREAVERDGLVYRGSLRVRMCTEFLRIYKEIDDTAHELQFKSVAILVGGIDKIVSPSGIEAFVGRIQSDDKKMFLFDNLGHDVLKEKGCEQAIQSLVQWFSERI